MYVKCADDVHLIIALYVDDMLLTGRNERHIADFKANLNASFEMSDLGHLHHYLGIQFKQCDGGIALFKQSILIHCCVDSALRIVSLLLLLWRQV